jgi:hypothetical protein
MLLYDCDLERGSCRTEAGCCLSWVYELGSPLQWSTKFTIRKIKNQKLNFLWALYTDQHIILLFNVTADTPIFTNTCILQFILYLYNILWASGIPQRVSVKHICNLGSACFEGLGMTQWRSKHVALYIYHLMYMK